MRALVLVALLGINSSWAEPQAELPRVFVDTTMPASTGATITVAAGGNLRPR